MVPGKRDLLRYRGCLSQHDMPGEAMLGFRRLYGEVWAGRWNHAAKGKKDEVLAVTVYAPSRRRTLSLQDWDVEHEVDILDAM